MLLTGTLTVYWLYVVDILFNLLQWNCHRWTSQKISWLTHLWSQVSITDTSYFKMEDRINSYGTWFIFKVSERWHASQIAERLLCNSIVISVCYIALYIHQTKVDETDGLTWWYLSASRGCRILVKQNSEFCWTYTNYEHQWSSTYRSNHSIKAKRTCSSSTQLFANSSANFD